MQRARALALVAALVPLVAGALIVGAPDLFSASLFSALAVAVHGHRRFMNRWAKVVDSYVTAAVIAAAAVAIQAALGLPMGLTAAIAAVTIAISSSGQAHPPAAGLPLTFAGASTDLLAFRHLGMGILGVTYALLVWRLILGTRYGTRRTVASWPLRKGEEEAVPHADQCQ